MISTIFLPLLFFLIYKDIKTGKIEIYYWKPLFLFVISFLLLFDPLRIFLILGIFQKFGILLLTLILFFVSITVFGGADVLFLILLFFCTSDVYLLEIFFDFSFFLRKLAFFVILGILNKGIFVNESLSIEFITNYQFRLTSLKKRKSKTHFSPQFFFIFFSFI